MRRRTSGTIALAIAIALSAEACGTGGADKPAGKPVVVVSVVPQAYFVERIAGDRVIVSVLVGPGQSPHAYEPTPRQMAELASASTWFSIGAEFEKGFLPKAAALYPGLRIVDTTVGIRYRTLEAHSHEGEAEEGHDEDEEGGPDPHVWLGRQAVKAMAATMRDALAAADPAGAAVYAANHDAFVRDVDAVYDGMLNDLAALRGSTVFVYHPAFGYLLDDLGLRQEAVETGGKEPTQKALAALIEKARRDGARVVFVQAQFPTGAARAVAGAIGGSVVAIDPLARNWLGNLRLMAAELRKAAELKKAAR